LDMEESIFSKMIALTLANCLECKLISRCLQIYSINYCEMTCGTA
jgi:hypothetical protein